MCNFGTVERTTWCKSTPLWPILEQQASPLVIEGAVGEHLPWTALRWTQRGKQPAAVAAKPPSCSLVTTEPSSNSASSTSAFAGCSSAPNDTVGLDNFIADNGHRCAEVRFCKRPSDGSRTPWEGQCEVLKDVPVAHFGAWLLGAVELLPPDDALRRFLPVHEWCGYCAYQHFEDFFPEVFSEGEASEELEDDDDEEREMGNGAGEGKPLDVLRDQKNQDRPLPCLDFSHILSRELPAPGGPTLWLGSQGARTPCHQDAYGVNLVAQLAGQKRWVLLPPDNASHMGLSRLPFEDASTFTTLDPLAEPLPPAARPLEVVLGPLDLLFVPRHWIHAVESISPWTLSINQWFSHPLDPKERVHEAATRVLASPLLEFTPPGCDWWLNPNEELYDLTRNIDNLRESLVESSKASSARQLSGLTNKQIQAAFMHAATHPEVIQTIVGRMLERLEVPPQWEGKPQTPIHHNTLQHQPQPQQQRLSRSRSRSRHRTECER